MAVLGAALQAVGWAFLPFVLLPFAVLLIPRVGPFAEMVAGTVSAFNRGLGEVVKWLLPILVVSVVFTVVALSIFGWASTKLDESATYLHTTALMLGMAATLLADEHVRVDILYSRMADGTKALVDFCGFYLLLLPLMLVILWESQADTAFAWASFEGSPDSAGIRGRFLLKTLIPLFALTMIAQGIAIATRAAIRIRGR